MKRYITIDDQDNILNAEKREMVLLKANPCCHRRHCKFCDYYLDNVGLKPDEIISFNKEVLSNVSGKFGLLEVINSGSVFELPSSTINEIMNLAIKKNISTIYFESFPGYMKKIPTLKSLFLKNGITLRFRVGLETFNEEFRVNVLGKKIYNSLIHDIEEVYYSTCLIVGIEGQSKKDIINDIDEGLAHFKKITINVFCKNTTKIGIDYSLIQWFKEYAIQNLQGNDRIEIFLDNNILL